MLRALIALVLVATVVSAVPAQNKTTPEDCTRDKQIVGQRITTVDGKTTYRLVMWNYGVEQWEEGKRYEKRKQRWSLQCSYPSVSAYGDEADSTWCQLERLVIDDWSDTIVGEKVIAIHTHSTTTRDLAVTRANWGSGELDFEFEMTDGNKIAVFLNLVYVPLSSGAFSGMCLDSFKAYSAGRLQRSRSAYSVEYRLQSYDEVIQVPIEMKGFYTGRMKLQNAITAGLNEKDIGVWQEIQSTAEQTVKEISRSYLLEAPQHVTKTYGKPIDKLSAEESAELNTTMVMELKQRILPELSRLLSEAGVSEAGTKHIIKCYSSSLEAEE